MIDTDKLKSEIITRSGHILKGRWARVYQIVDKEQGRDSVEIARDTKLTTALTNQTLEQLQLDGYTHSVTVKGINRWYTTIGIKAKELIHRPWMKINVEELFNDCQN